MILKDIWLDVKAVKERDPAARSALEVLLLYQGVHALIWHRIAHWFYQKRMFFIARLISQIARFFTLIEIHPGWNFNRPRRRRCDRRDCGSGRQLHHLPGRDVRRRGHEKGKTPPNSGKQRDGGVRS